MPKMTFENHIMKQFDEELEEIRTQLMEMGGKVEQQLKNAIKAVIKADSSLAEEVIRDERLVDEMEVDIDEACILIIARRQPAASDLRFVMMVTKAVNDLERIGDEAKKIARKYPGEKIEDVAKKVVYWEEFLYAYGEEDKEIPLIVKINAMPIIASVLTELLKTQVILKPKPELQENRSLIFFEIL